MKKLLEVALTLTAVDKATRVIDEATRQQLKKLDELNNKSRAMFAAGAGLTAAGVALAAPLVMATNAAIDFEDKLADVGKVLNLRTGSQGLAVVSNEIKDMSVYLGRMPEDVAGLYAALAQGGVPAKELDKVGKIVGEMSVAFDMLPEESGDAFQKMRNAMNLSVTEGEKAVDAFNFLSDNQASKAREILTFMSAGGAGVANTMKSGAPMMAAFGSTLISQGKSAAEAATIMERFQKGLLSNEEIAPIFKAAGGGVNGMLTVLKHGMKQKDPFEYFKNFGEYGVSIMQMAQNYDMLFGALTSVNNEMNYLDSATKEFNNRSATTKGQLSSMMSLLRVGWIEFGDVFLPGLNKALKAITPIIKALRDWAKEHPKLMEAVGIVMAIVSAMLILAGAILIVKAGMMALNATFLANPIVAAIMAIIVVVTLLVIYWEDFMNWFDNQGGIIRAIVGVIIGPFVMLAALVKSVMKAIEGDWSGAWEIMKEALIKFNPFSLFGDLLSGMYDVGAALISGLWEGIKSGWSDLMNQIKGMADMLAFEFKSALGINSPSRVFMEFGKNITAGAALGVATSMPMAATASADLGNVMTPPPIGSTFGVKNTGVGSSSGTTINYNPTITIQGGATVEAQQNFAKLLQEHKTELLSIIQMENERQARRRF